VASHPVVPVRHLESAVFALVAAAFTTIYITQPVLPVIQETYGVDAAQASRTVSAVILGITLSNLPFGLLADRLPIRSLLAVGMGMVVACNLTCTWRLNLNWLVAVRFVQGLFIPALTTCLAAYLARTLPQERLNVVMGTYVSATVAGGLGGRLLGGLIYPTFDWRKAFLAAAVLLSLAGVTALRRLPPEKRQTREAGAALSFGRLLGTPALALYFAVAFSAFFVFSSIFNYMPFYLASPAFGVSTRIITLLYLAYVVGMFVGPLAGRCSNRFGNGSTLIGGTVVFMAALLLSLVRALPAVVASLLGVCAGFFAIHAAAAGGLNRQLSHSRGKANALYVLFYYAGGTVGISASGVVYQWYGWMGVVVLGGSMLLIPFVTGLWIGRRPAPAAGDAD